MPRSYLSVKNYGEIGGVQATVGKITLKEVGGVIVPEFSQLQEQPNYITKDNEHITDRVQFDQTILWSLIAAGYTITIDGITYSSGTLEHAHATMPSDNTIEVLHGIWSGASDEIDTIVCRRLDVSPSLPNYFEIVGTLHIVCNDSQFVGQSVGAPTFFFGFHSAGGPVENYAPMAGIAIDVTSQFIRVFPITLNNYGGPISYTQPMDVLLNYKIRKTPTEWYVELSDGANTYIASESMTIDPQTFIIQIGEHLTALPIDERVTTTVTIDNISSL